MDIDIIGVAGFVFAAALGRLIYERRMDVLYGPYIEGRDERRTISLSLRRRRPILLRLRPADRNGC